MAEQSYFETTIRPVWEGVRRQPPRGRADCLENLTRCLERAHGNIDTPLVQWVGGLLQTWPTEEDPGFPELRAAIKNLVLCLDKRGHGNALIDLLSPVTEREAWFQWGAGTPCSFQNLWIAFDGAQHKPAGFGTRLMLAGLTRCALTQPCPATRGTAMERMNHALQIVPGLKEFVADRCRLALATRYPPSLIVPPKKPLTETMIHTNAVTLLQQIGFPATPAALKSQTALLTANS